MTTTNRRQDLARVRHHFFVCTNRRLDGHPLPSCARRGSEAVYEAFLREMARRRFPAGLKVTATGCLTPCQCGPNVVIYPEGIWYAEVTEADVAEIVAAHVDRNTVIARLLLPLEVRI